METQHSKDMAVFLGYEDVPLSKAIGEKTSARVKCLPVRAFAEYAALIDMEVDLIALATDLTPEQIDMLAPGDSGKVFEKIHELNFEPFSAWLKRKAAATKLKAKAFGIDLPKKESTASGESSAS